MQESFADYFKQIGQYILILERNGKPIPSAEEMAEEIIEFVHESELDEDIQYEIEIGLYSMLDYTKSTKVLLKKAKTFINKKVYTQQYKRYEQGATYYDPDDTEDDNEQFDGYIL